MRAPRLILAFAGLALALGGVVLATRHRHAEAAPPDIASPSAPAGRPFPGLAAATGIERFTLGGRRTYAVEASYTTALTREQGTAAVPIEIAGLWQVTVVRAGAEGVLLRSTFSGRANVAGRAEPGLGAELAQPHYLAFAPGGRFVAAHFRPEQDDLARGIAQSLAATLQLPGVDGGAASWQSEESDASGHYLARYERSGRSLEKIKLKYLPGDRAPAARDLRARAKYQLGDDSWPAALDSQEAVTFVEPGLTVRVGSRVVLSRTATAVVPVEVGLDGYETERVGEPSSHDSIKGDRALLAGATLDDLLGALAAGGDDARSSVAARLEALLRLDPASAAEMARRLIAGADRATAKLLLGVLGSAGTPAAQDALVKILGAATLAPNDRARAATAMAMLERPNDKVVAGLKAQLDAPAPALARSSATALGISALRLRTVDEPRAKAVVDDLVGRLAATGDRAAQAAILHALGNAGDARALPALQPFLTSDDPSLRRAAVEALRLLSEPSVDGLLAQAMLADADPAVRRAAVFASSERAVGPLLGALTRALGDQDDGVRLEVVQLLGQHAGEAAAADLLARAAHGDPAESVRDEAQRLLASR
jgi:HEAT repeat protein